MGEGWRERETEKERKGLAAFANTAPIFLDADFGEWESEEEREGE